ncbi:SMI1/KNR4 family protein [Deinococcus sonorensis]|uniref:SMI1/KNR4 family protein n=2 Tax=Deinococcus sonorensis TaxID=309891 RepID=A0AAU7UDM7_9DEIO
MNEQVFALPLAWNPPASPEDLERTAEQLRMDWPEEVAALYRQHDGAAGLADDWEDAWAERLDTDEDACPQVPRLMPLDEVRDFYSGTSSFVMPDIRLFWSDDNSNYVGVYVGEVFTGAVCLLHHEEQTEVAPRFHRVSDFLAWMVAHPDEDVFSSTLVPSLYPRVVPDPETSELEWAAAYSLYARADRTTDNPLLAVAMNATPVEHSSELLSYLDHEDFYIAERAVEILGTRRYLPARKAIEHLAVHGVANARSAALRVLSRW